MKMKPQHHHSLLLLTITIQNPGTVGNITGYTVTNSIQIESSNINNISRWIDIAISTGANRVDSIYFSVSDKKLDDIKNNLLNDAINNAKYKADNVASILGLKVIGVRSINLNEFESPPPIPQPYLAREILGLGGRIKPCIYSYSNRYARSHLANKHCIFTRKLRPTLLYIVNEWALHLLSFYKLVQ